MSGAAPTIRAPGKVILLGEHAVVYGHPALAGALDRGVTVEIGIGHTLAVPAWGVEVAPHDPSAIGRAFTAILTALDLDRSPARFVARFEVPTGAGLGSSAALAVALTRAIALATCRALTAEEELEAAMAAETVFHGRASGIDHAVSARGGLGLFRRAAGLSPIRAACPVPLCVGHSGRERDTLGRVARVAELTRERPDEMRARFQAIAGLVDRAAAAIGAGRLGELGAVMDENQRHLAAMELSCEEIDRMCALAHDAGAVGAKLTGGGGGGCVLALAPGREEAIRASWAAAGFTSFVTAVGAP